MSYPIDLKQLSTEELIKGYAAACDPNRPGEFREWESVIAEYRAELESRIEAADSLGLFALAQLVAKYFPGSFDLPIRKKITYSPTGEPGPRWIGILSRKNRGMGGES